jgi:drug/metabolite transporter (DMT)-like permease
MSMPASVWRPLRTVTAYLPIHDVLIAPPALNWGHLPLAGDCSLGHRALAHEPSLAARNVQRVVILLALISAAGWGVSDFFGGVFSKRHGAWVTTVAVQFGALAGTALAVLLLGGSPTPADWAWGAAAGLGVGAGTAFLYRGLSTGRMGVVAPVSAVGAALVPVAVGVSIGERPGPLAAVGILTALPAIWLIASTDGSVTEALEDVRTQASTGLLDGVLAGIGFGAGFACLDRVQPAAELTPLLATQVVSLVPVIALALWTKQPFWPRQRRAWIGFILGPLGTVANACLLWAVQAGLLSIVSVLVSFYPAVTVALAAALLREHIHRAQAVGLGLAVVAISLISLA